MSVDGGDKAALRRQLRAARASLDPAQRRAQIEATVAALQDWLEQEPATLLASYAAAGSELDLGALHRLRWDAGQPLLLPRAGQDHRLHWHLVAEAALLRPGYRGILEPDPARCPERALDQDCVVLVPGLGFTAGGERLGQGGGFYDRCLGARRHRLSVGIGFSCQLLPAIPSEDHDALLDRVLIAGSWRR